MAIRVRRVLFLILNNPDFPIFFFRYRTNAMPNASKYIVSRDRKIVKGRTGNVHLNGRITLMEIDYGLSSSPFYDLNILGYVQETRFCI